MSQHPHQGDLWIKKGIWKFENPKLDSLSVYGTSAGAGGYPPQQQQQQQPQQQQAVDQQQQQFLGAASVAAAAAAQQMSNVCEGGGELKLKLEI